MPHKNRLNEHPSFQLIALGLQSGLTRFLNTKLYWCTKLQQIKVTYSRPIQNLIFINCCSKQNTNSTIFMRKSIHTCTIHIHTYSALHRDLAVKTALAKVKMYFQAYWGSKHYNIIHASSSLFSSVLADMWPWYGLLVAQIRQT